MKSRANFFSIFYRHDNDCWSGARELDIWSISLPLSITMKIINRRPSHFVLKLYGVVHSRPTVSIWHHTLLRTSWLHIYYHLSTVSTFISITTLTDSESSLIIRNIICPNHFDLSSIVFSAIDTAPPIILFFLYSHYAHVSTVAYSSSPPYPSFLDYHCFFFFLIFHLNRIIQFVTSKHLERSILLFTLLSYRRDNIVPSKILYNHHFSWLLRDTVI